MGAALDLSRDALPGGPSELAYTWRETANIALEKLTTRLDVLSQSDYPRCARAEVMRRIARLQFEISEMEQCAGGSRV